MCEIRVVPPMAASFHSKVGTFAPLRLNKNNYHVRIATTKSLSVIGRLDVAQPGCCVLAGPGARATTT